MHATSVGRASVDSQTAADPHFMWPLVGHSRRRPKGTDLPLGGRHKAEGRRTA